MQNAQDVNAIIDHLAAKLGTSVAELWSVLIRQVYVDADQNIGVFVLAIVAVVVMVRFWKAKQDDDDYEVLIISGGVLTTILAIGGLICAFQAAGEFANPRYYAVKQIFEAFKR